MVSLSNREYLPGHALLFVVSGVSESPIAAPLPVQPDLISYTSRTDLCPARPPLIIGQ